MLIWIISSSLAFIFGFMTAILLTSKAKSDSYESGWLDGFQHATHGGLLNESKRKSD